jgi:hypothetical protein
MDKIHIFELYPTSSLCNKYYVIDNKRFINSNLTKILARKLLVINIDRHGIWTVDKDKTNLNRKKYCARNHKFIKTGR